jgi:hypothetical protein
MSISNEEIVDEILHGPLTGEIASYWSSADDEKTAAILNRVDRVGPVPTEEVVSYFLIKGITGYVLASVEIPIGTELFPGVDMTFEVKSTLRTIESVITENFYSPTVSVTDTLFNYVCDNLISILLMTTQQKAELQTLANNRISRSEEVWEQPVTANQIGQARNGGVTYTYDHGKVSLVGTAPFTVT